MSDKENAVHDIEQVTAYKVGDRVYTSYAEAVVAAKDAEFDAIIDDFLSPRLWGLGGKVAAANVLRDFLVWQTTRNQA
jgi:hypothetical protein